MVFPAKKILRYVFALFFIITLNFFLPRAMPGDPVINLLGEDFIAGKEAVEKIREELGLNRPILVQYANYWKNLFQFDLGYSYHFRARVSSLIISRLKWTFILVAPSLILGTIIGALAGSLAGWKRKSKGNRLSKSQCFFGRRSRCVVRCSMKSSGTKPPFLKRYGRC